jgi:ribA/ribD-fused uncharacterized protein
VFPEFPDDAVFVSMTDALDPLAPFSKHAFVLEDLRWPSVEHYYQAMKFDDAAHRERIRSAPHPAKAHRLGRKRRPRIRSDWDDVRETIMTRGTYIKCRTHPEVAAALLATGERMLVENSQYDYFWGIGRDTRGHNRYGKVLARVRDRLREEARDSER